MYHEDSLHNVLLKAAADGNALVARAALDKGADLHCKVQVRARGGGAVTDDIMLVRAARPKWVSAAQRPRGLGAAASARDGSWPAARCEHQRAAQVPPERRTATARVMFGAPLRGRHRHGRAERRRVRSRARSTAQLAEGAAALPLCRSASVATLPIERHGGAL
jgi:hypothetical protein